MSVAAAPSRVELRLKQRYQDQIAPRLIQRFAYSNVHQVPRLIKVVLNIGIGEAIQNPKALDAAVSDLQKISGQKPVVQRSRKAIANFKLRAGLPIGVKVTMRAARMYQFIDKLISTALPRIRDFRGISPTAFDGPTKTIGSTGVPFLSRLPSAVVLSSWTDCSRRDMRKQSR